MSVMENMRRKNKPPAPAEQGQRFPDMPPAPRMPAPPAPMAPVYDEEVLRVAQRDYENRRLITQLEAERDEWRRKALSAEGECRRLEMIIGQDKRSHEDAMARLTYDRDRKVEELTQRRDDYKLNLARFETKLGIQGKAILDLANSISKTVLETMDELKGEKGSTSDVAGTVGLAAIADAISNDPEFREVDEMPRVVRAGPADGE